MIIKELRVTLSNILLYPSESDIIKQSLESCTKEIMTSLETEPSLTISEAEGKLLLNDKSIDTPGGILLDCFVACKIKSVTFKPGFTQTELYNLLHELSSKHTPTPSEHIGIDEKLYVAMGDKDLLIAKGKEKLGTEDKVLLHIDEIANLVGGSGQKDEIKKQLMEALGLGKSEAKPAQETTPETTEEKHPGEEKDFDAKELLKKDNEYMLDDKLLQRLPALLENLRSPEELETAGDLCNKLAFNLEARVVDTRLKAAIAFKKLYSVIESLRDPKIIKNVDKKFVEVGRKETDGKVYKEIADTLGKGATRYLKQGDYASTQMITEMLGTHAKSAEFLERKESAKSAMDGLAGTDFTKLLIYDLCSKEEERREKATSILLDMGESCIHPLIRELKEAPDMRLRKAIADVIAQTEETGVIQLLNEIKSEPSPTAASNMLDVLDGIGYEAEVVEGLRIRKLLYHPNFYIRRKVVDILFKIGISSAKQLLLEATDDEATAVKEKAIAYLGELHHMPAVPKIIGMLEKNKKEEELTQISMCKTLGGLGDKKAIPALFRIASPGNIFRQARPKQVRMAAIEALATLGDEKVKQFIRDRDKSVQRFTKQLIGEEDTEVKE